MTDVPNITVDAVGLTTGTYWEWATGQPRWRHRQASVVDLDPCPAYPHDIDLVRTTITAVARLVPPIWNIEVFVADREEVGRSNGHSNVTSDGGYHRTGGDGVKTWVKGPNVGLIFLSGKRVPPHPAMTRYLVGHEYGHHVQWMLSERLGYHHVHDDQMLLDYAALRGLPGNPLHGYPGGWHHAVAEVFACDFRTIVTGIEDGYWPHPGVDRPDDTVVAWWTASLAALNP